MHAAFFSTPKALISGWGSLSAGPPISKFCRDLETSHERLKMNVSEDVIPLRLGTPVTISGDFNLAKGISLQSKFLVELRLRKGH